MKGWYRIDGKSTARSPPLGPYGIWAIITAWIAFNGLLGLKKVPPVARATCHEIGFEAIKVFFMLPYLRCSCCGMNGHTHDDCPYAKSATGAMDRQLFGSIFGAVKGWAYFNQHLDTIKARVGPNEPEKEWQEIVPQWRGVDDSLQPSFMDDPRAVLLGTQQIWIGRLISSKCKDAHKEVKQFRAERDKKAKASGFSGQKQQQSHNKYAGKQKRY